jgi:hypothetical protein
MFPPLSRRRAPERLPKKGFALFEATAEFAKPRQHRGAQGIPPTAGQVAGCLFFGSFLWASKEMNSTGVAGIHIERIIAAEAAPTNNRYIPTR